MKTIKVYKYSLNNLLILDTENKTKELCFMKRELEDGDKTRITKTTINKHRKDYEENVGDSFVITSPILANFSDDEEEREYHRQRAKNILVGEYESMEDLKQDIKKMYDATQIIRRQHHFVNFASDLLDVLNSFITKKTLTDEKQIAIAKAIRDEKKGGIKMKINTSLDFRSFINELDLKYSSTKEKEFLYNMFKYIDRDLYILDLEKRKVILSSQTFSLDSDWISNADKTILYELYIKTYLNSNEDSIVLTFNTLEKLKKVEQFIKDNFKFLNKEE